MPEMENTKNKPVNVIIPQRYIPFDLGANINNVIEKEMKKYFLSNNYNELEKSQLLNSISFDVRFVVDINYSNLKLYIYSYGIGVFMLEDAAYKMNERYAAEYCESRKKAHKEILEERQNETSKLIEKIIADLRNIVKAQYKNIRKSASPDWESKGLSYVMTVSYIFKKDNKEKKDYNEFSLIDKQNLQIMLQPSIAHMEDMLSVQEYDDTQFDPYNFDVKKIDEPKNWIKSKDCSIYISWAAVVVFLEYLHGNYMTIMEYMEADLQAMWLYTYCQYDNLKSFSSEKSLTSRELKKLKYNFQKKYNEFTSNKDSSLTIYMTEIKKELIRTSGIDKEKQNYIDYIDFCIDEAESIEMEKQQKYSVLNEIFLFIIAFLQIAPLLYKAMIGGLENLHIVPIIVMILVAIFAIAIIIRKK